MKFVSFFVRKYKEVGLWENTTVILNAMRKKPVISEFLFQVFSRMKIIYANEVCNVFKEGYSLHRTTNASKAIIYHICFLL